MVLFDVIRSYEEILEIINRERISNVVDLPCKIEMDNYFDDDKITDFILNTYLYVGWGY